GEAACVSVHGANRLGTNSLVDLVVYGRRAGRHVAEFVKGADMPPLPDGAGDAFREKLDRLKHTRGEHPGPLYERMQEVMMEKVGVYRTHEEMGAAVSEMRGLRERLAGVGMQDENASFNQEVLSILELENLLDLSLVTAASALNRTESRGAHSREDYPDRDDEQWLKHTLAYLRGNEVTIDYKSVDTSIWAPKPRTY
ncbi:MAG: succinate dehydrogenase/fumarate reductase flavoprotein subunit, partial [Spirochaetota bacterium]